MSDLKKMYKTIMDDNFPDTMTITFGDQTLVYKKRAWKIPEAKTGELIEKGLRYGENPDQQAALFELVNGNLVLGDCKYIEPGNGLVSSDHPKNDGRAPKSMCHQSTKSHGHVRNISRGP